ncbi:MAG: MFS transporter [Chloroflexi bacterium]|nr:MFS transporter [Chloroflexota bacterium]
MALSLPRTRRPPVFYGWWIVVATSVMLAFLAGSVFWSFSFLVSPVRAELGWSAGAIAGAYLIQGVVGAIQSPIAGALFDRFGPRVVASGGIFIGGLGLLLLSQAHSLPHFYIAYALAGTGLVSVFATAIPAVGNWFLHRRGLALGLATAGIALAGVMAPVVVVLVDWVGWRATLAVLALATWIFMLPLALVLRRRPEEYNMLPDGVSAVAESRGAVGMTGDRGVVEGATTAEALRRREFWFLGFCFTMGFWAIGSIQVHQAPYLEGAGISRELAAATVTALSLVTVLGRVLFGWLADRFDLRVLTGVALAIQTVGIVVFAQVDGSRTWLLLPFLLLFSPALGGLMVLQPSAQGWYFGRRAFGTLSGINYAVGTISWAGGPYLLGLIYDWMGDYRPGLFLLAALCLTGIPALLGLAKHR